MTRSGSPSQTARPRRGIGSISHFFLSQPDSDSGDRPHRVPPNPAKQSDYVEEPLCAVEDKSPNGIPDILLGEAVFADHLADHRRRLNSYVRHLNGQEENVAVIELDCCEAKLLGEYNEQNGSFNQTIIAETENSGRTLIPELNKLAEDNDILLISFDHSFGDSAKELIRKCTWVTVLCTCESSDVVETYKTIKWLVREVGWDDKISLYICDEAGSSEQKSAKEIFDKLSDAAQKFLKADLQLTNCHSVSETVVNNDLAADLSDVTQSREADIFNCPEYSQGPKEKDSLQGAAKIGFSEWPQPESANRKAENQAIGGTNRPLVFSPVNLERLPENDCQLSDALQCALPGWLIAVPGAMVVPVSLPADIDTAARILVDANGRLYVLLASLCPGENVLPRALAARKWLNENLQLVLGQFRQLQIDRTSAVGLILVSGGVIDLLKASCCQISEFPCHLMELILLQDGQKWSLLPRTV